MFFCERIKSRQTVTVAGKSHGNGGNALHRRVKLAQLLKGIGQLVAVIIAGTKHKLGIYLDTCVGKPFYIFKHLAGTLVAHHFNPQLGIHRVN